LIGLEGGFVLYKNYKFCGGCCFYFCSAYLIRSLIGIIIITFLRGVRYIDEILWMGIRARWFVVYIVILCSYVGLGACDWIGFN